MGQQSVLQSPEASTFSSVQCHVEQGHYWSCISHFPPGEQESHRCAFRGRGSCPGLAIIFVLLMPQVESCLTRDRKTPGWPLLPTFLDTFTSSLAQTDESVRTGKNISAALGCVRLACMRGREVAGVGGAIQSRTPALLPLQDRITVCCCCSLHVSQGHNPGWCLHRSREKEAGFVP